MARILTVEEAAEMLRLNPQVVREYLRKRKLPGCKIGRHWRISEEEIDRFVHQGGQEASVGLALSDRRVREWKSLSQEERDRRVRAARGMCAGGGRTVDDFLRNKHQEVEEEDRRAQERHEAWLRRNKDRLQ